MEFCFPSKQLLSLAFFSLLLDTTPAFPSLPRHHLPFRRLKGRHDPIIEDLEEDHVSNSKKNDFKTFFYDQTIDHFNYRPESYTTFKQRYLINDKYWGGPKTNSPIFVFFGAEENIDDDIQGVGFLNHYAPQFKALIIFIEHRFYGRSNPYKPMFSTLSDVEHRGYFNSAQALADYAEIILHLKNTFKADHCPVIVFGGSYGGMLAAWFRLKYPHVAIGALASSAPILVRVKSPYAYTNWVSKDYRETSETCYNTIKQSWAEIERVASKPKGLAILTKTFKLCRPLKSSRDLKKLKDLLKSTFANAAQYDAPPYYPVSEVCKAIDGAPTDTYILEKVFLGFTQIAYFDTQRNCYDIIDNSESTIGWNWQACSEILDPSNAAANNSMFEPEPWTTEKYVEDCKITVKVRTRPHWLDTYYGGKDIEFVLRNFASNIIFYNGMRDPLSQLSVVENISETLLVVNAPRGSHCLDLQKPSRTDPKWLVMVREKEVAIIKDWIAKYHADLAALAQG